MRYRIVFTLVLALTPVLPAQTPLEIDLDRARVDAVVTDSQGRHVPGLTQKDFVLHQDGSTKPITSVAWVNESPASIVFVIDDLSMRLGDYLAVQDALRRFVGGQMRPGQRVSVIRVSGGSGILQQLTNDQAMLRKEIDRMTWEPTHNPSETLAWFLHDSTLQLQRIPGYKTMIVFTTREHRYPLFEIWNAEDAAWRSAAAINVIAVDGAGGAPNLFPFDDGGDEIGLLKREEVLRMTNTVRFSDGGQDLSTHMPATGAVLPAQSGFTSPIGGYKYFGLSRLASASRGLYLEDRDLYHGIVQSVGDAEGFYTLEWSPGREAISAPKKTAPGASTPPFTTVEITAIDPALHVHSREGFQRHGAVHFPENPTLRQRTIEETISPYKGSDIEVRMTSSYHFTKLGGYVESLIHADVRALKFYKDPAGCETGTADLLWFGQTNRQTSRIPSERSEILQIHACGTAIVDLKEKGLVATVHDPVSEAGVLTVFADVHTLESGDPLTVMHPHRGRDVTVHDPKLIEREPQAQPRLFGSARQIVSVPNLLTQGIFVCGLTVGDVPEHEEQKALSYRAAQDRDPAIRQFHPGDIVAWEFQILNSEYRRNKSHKTNARVAIVRGGRVIADGIPQTVSWMDRDEAIVRGQYRLSATAEPGEYLLGAIAEDISLDEKGHPFNSTAWINFAVLP